MPECRKCGVDKPLTEFPPKRWAPKGPHERKRQCITCWDMHQRAYRERNRARQTAYMRDYYRANIDIYKQKHLENKELNNKRARINTMKRRFGMDYEARDAMLASQGGVCAICGTSDPGPKDWHIDHCHEINVVRGILCHYCNVGLGHMKDDVSVLERAISYLRKYKCS